MENETVEIRLQQDTLVDVVAQKEADINTLTEQLEKANEMLQKSTQVIVKL